jgi:hypothetical protein
MTCQIEDDDGDWSSPAMLIMRGNSAGEGVYEDENGKTPAWPKGALHEGPAKEYAVLVGFKPKVLDVSGDPNRSKGKDNKYHSSRDDSAGTLMALECFRLHNSIVAFYGFSGGGYNLWHILNKMTAQERARVRWVTVVGVDSDRPKSDYENSKFPPGSWHLDYLPNSGNHMFLPEKLLWRAKRDKGLVVP